MKVDVYYNGNLARGHNVKHSDNEKNFRNNEVY